MKKVSGFLLTLMFVLVFAFSSVFARERNLSFYADMPILAGAFFEQADGEAIGILFPSFRSTYEFQLFLGSAGSVIHVNTKERDCVVREVDVEVLETGALVWVNNQWLGMSYGFLQGSGSVTKEELITTKVRIESKSVRGYRFGLHFSISPHIALQVVTRTFMPGIGKSFSVLSTGLQLEF